MLSKAKLKFGMSKCTSDAFAHFQPLSQEEYIEPSVMHKH